MPAVGFFIAGSLVLSWSLLVSWSLLLSFSYCFGLSFEPCATNRSCVPLSRCTFLLVGVISEPCVLLEAAVFRLSPSSPNTPWLLEVSWPAAFKPPTAPRTTPAVFPLELTAALLAIGHLPNELRALRDHVFSFGLGGFRRFCGDRIAGLVFLGVYGLRKRGVHGRAVGKGGRTPPGVRRSGSRVIAGSRCAGLAGFHGSAAAGRRTRLRASLGAHRGAGPPKHPRQDDHSCESHEKLNILLTVEFDVVLHRKMEELGLL